jgi:DNA invertase Pin-like site-specific DNA recombinase
MLIGYARISRSSQDASLQLDALTRAGAERIFEEQASGANMNRPELQKALQFARSGDALCVWKLDRLGRNVRELVGTVEDLRTRGIGLRSLTENIDTESPTGALVFNIFATLAQAELDALKMRTRAGLEAARARGRVGGRPRKLTEAKVALAKALLADGRLTVREVAKEIGVGASSLYRAMQKLPKAA